MFKMISIDLDGTLLKNDKSISNETYYTLKKISEMGYIIVISTGRSMIGIPKTIKEMNFIDYFITSNGASCIDRNGTYLITNWIKYNDIKDLIIDNKFFVEYLISGNWYISSDDIAKIKNVIQDEEVVNYILSTRRIINNDLSLENNNMSIEKINLNFSQNNLDYANNKVNLFVESNSNIRYWTDKKHKLDIYSIAATKGNTLIELANLLNISSSNIIAFGDDDNDLEMLQKVGWPVSMKNGNDNVKKYSKEITEYDNDNDGVVKYLIKFLNVDNVDI